MSPKIIISDDDPVILFLHDRLVINSGWDAPLLFSNAIETLSYLRDNKHDGHTYFLLLDINMPGMSGWELLDQINAHGLAGIQVAIISSSVNADDHEKADSYNQVVAFVEKPVTGIKMRQLIERMKYEQEHQ